MLSQIVHTYKVSALRLAACSLLLVAAPALLSPTAAEAQGTVGIRAQNPTVVGDGIASAVFIIDVTGGDARAEPWLQINAAGLVAVETTDRGVLDGTSVTNAYMNGDTLSLRTRVLPPGTPSIDVIITIVGSDSTHTTDPNNPSATVTVTAPSTPPPNRVFLSNEDEVASTPDIVSVQMAGLLSHAAQAFTTGPGAGSAPTFIPRSLTLWFGSGTASNLQSSELTVAIWRDNQNGGGPLPCNPATQGGSPCRASPPGKYITLTNPDNLVGAGAKVFTYSGGDDLDRDVPYHIVVEYRGTGTVELHQTEDADVTASLSGWSIGDIRSGEDGIWAPFTVQRGKLRFKLEGIHKNVPATGIPSVMPRGVPAVGQTLTAMRGTIDDANGLPSSADDFRYQWLRYETDSNSSVAIASATNTTYEVHSDDVGKRLGVRVSYTDDDNYPEMVESGPATRAVAATAPTVGVRAQNSTVVGDGVNDIVFIFDVADDRTVGIDYSVTGTGYETPRTLLDVADGHMLALPTSLLTPGSASVPVTLTLHAVLTTGYIVSTTAGAATVNVNSVPNTPPGAPTGLVAETGALSIVLKWQAPADTGGSAITGYRIEQSADGSSNWTDLLADTMSPDTRYVHGSLSSGQVVHYRVSAINFAGMPGAASSPAVMGTAGGAGPGAPQNLSAVGGPLLIDLRWDAPASDGGSAITGYRVESSANGSAPWTELVADTGSANRVYVHRGLSSGQTVHYRVSAINSLGTGTASSPASATAAASGSTPGRTRANFEPVGEPRITGAFSLGTPAIMVHFDEISDSNGLEGVRFEYRLRIFDFDGNFESNQGGGPNPFIGLNANTYSHDFDNFDPSYNRKRLGVWVRYTDDDGNMEEIQTGVITPLIENPFNVPEITLEPRKTPIIGGSDSAAGEDAVFTLTRSRGTGSALTVSVAVTGSGAEYAAMAGVTEAVFPANQATVDVRVRTLALPPGSPQREVTLTVLEGDGYVAGLYDSAATRFNVALPAMVVTTPAPPAPPAVVLPGAPQNLAAISGRLSIILNWDAPTSDGGGAITGYRIERSATGSAPWTPIEEDTGDAGTRYTNSNLAAGQTFHYRVSAINAAGVGTESAPASAMAGAASIMAPPGAPTSFSATAATKAIWLRWARPAADGGSAITGYRIEQSANGRSGWSVVVEDTERTALAYAHVGLEANQTLHYRVSAINRLGAGEFSGTAYATTNAASNVPTASVVVQDAVVTGNGLDDVVFIITSSDGQDVNTGYTITGQDAITGRSAENQITGATTFRDDTQRRIATVELAPGSAPVDVTFTFLVAASGLTRSGHATATGMGSATVRVTAPAAPVSSANRILIGNTARDSQGITLGHAGVRGDVVNLDTPGNGYSQAFTTGSHALGYNIHSVALLSGVPSNNLGLGGEGATITLREAGVSGNPGAVVVATLRHPSSFRQDRLNVFTAPSGTMLDANTTYHLTVIGLSNVGGRMSLRRGAPSPPGIPGHKFYTNLGLTDEYPPPADSSEWMQAPSLSLMFQLRGSEAVDLSLPEITLSAEADTVLGDGRNFVRFFLTRSMNFPQRRVQYTLPVNGGVNSELETDTEMTYRFAGVGNPERIRLRTEELRPGSDPIDVTFNLLPGTGYRLGDTTSVTVSVVPLPAPALVGTLGDHRGHSLIALPQRGRDYAQGFRTGSNRGGYSLTGILVDIQEITSNFDSSVPVVMTIREEVSGNPAGTVFATLNPPSGFIDGRVVFTAQGSITLAADTRYYFVIGQDDAVGGLALNGAPAARNTPDTGSLAGWSVDDELKWNQGGNWGVATSGNADMRPLVMQLMGEPVAAPNTAPGAPQNLSATAGPLSIVLEWTAPDDDGGSAITGYRIERADAPGACSGSSTFPATPLVADTGNTDLTHTDTGRTAGETWCYRVSAINSVGTGAASGTADAVAGAASAAATAPGAPQNLSATAGPLSIVLEWTAPAEDGGSAITGYRIERADAPGACSGSSTFPATPLVADTGNTDLTHTDTGRTAGDTWCYRVSAINSVGTGPASATADAVAGAASAAATAPGAPRNLSATAGPLSIVLEWTAPADDGGSAITGYRIERADAPGACSGSSTFPATPLVADTGNTDLTHTDTGRTAGDTWCYRVSAINSVGTGPASAPADAVAGAASAAATAPGAPQNLSATAGPLSIVLEWMAPASDGGSAITGYRIERADAPGACSGSSTFPATPLVADTGNTDLTHTDMGLSAGDTWCYRVSAINAVGQGPASATANAVAGPDPMPSFGSATITAQQWQIGTAVMLELPVATGGDGALRYTLAPALPNGVQLSGAPACDPGCSISGTPAGVSAVRQDETYTWRADDADADTADSDAALLNFDISVAAIAPVTPPTGLQAFSDVGQIRLSWTAPSDNGGAVISGYRIERASGDCSGSPAFTERVADTMSAALTHTDTGLTAGDAWCYRVLAINTAGRGPASGADAARVLAMGEVMVELAPAALDAVEGAEDATLEITVNVSPAPAGDLSIPYEVVQATGVAVQATADADFALPAGPLTISAGTGSGVITATILADNVSEPAEGFAVMLGTPTSADAGEAPVLGSSVKTDVTIAASDPLAFALTTSSESVAEGERVTYTLAPAAGSPEIAPGVELEFAWAISGGDATAGDDYTTDPADTYTGTLTFSAADAAAQTVSVNIELDDTAGEADETFMFSVATPANAATETGGLELTPAGGALTTTITDTTDIPPVFGGVIVSNQLWTQSVSVSLALPTASGGNGALSYTLEGELPGGVVLNGAPGCSPGCTLSGASNVEIPARPYRWVVRDADRNTEADDTDVLTFTITVQAVETHEAQVHQATHAALALLAPNVASNTIQVLTSRFESLGTPGAPGAASNTARLGGRPLGSLAGEANSGLDVAREVASFFGFQLPEMRSGSGGAAGGAPGATRELAFAPARPGALEAQATENNTRGRGADEVSHWRPQHLDTWLGTQLGDWQKPDLRSLLLQSSFSIGLGAAHGADAPGAAGGSAGRWTLWGQGAAAGFEGREKGSTLWVEGESVSAYLGADVQREGLALGLALGLSSGDLDYSYGKDAGSGKLETELTSLYPYLNWSPNHGFNLYLMLGYGVGEGKLEVENLPSRLNSDLSMRMVALGGRRTLSGSHAGRRYEVKMDAFMVELDSEGARAPEGGGVDWRAVDTQSGRLRMALAGSAPLLQGSETLLAEGELAARLDGGDAQTGVGAELGAGLRWLSGGLSLAARGRLLLVHSESDFEDYREWGASLEASYDAGEVGRGFRATLSPVWGDAQSGAGALYESEGALEGFSRGGASGQRRSGLLPDHLAFEFGYGLGLLGGRATLLPFGSFTFAGGDSSNTQLRVGARIDLSQALGAAGDGALAVQRMGVELFGEEQAQAGAVQDRRVGLELRLGF